MEFKKIEPYNIKKNDNVYYKDLGNKAKVLYMQKVNKECPIQILNKDEYLYKSTGEILKIKHNEIRYDNIKSLKRTFRNLKDIININLVDTSKAKFITLTYADNMQDEEQLYIDFKNFMKRFKYYLKNDLNINNVEYISICEPQSRGAWHCHLILLFDVKAPFIANNTIANLWGNGFTKTVAFRKDVDDFGNYFCAYFTDLELENNEQFIIENYESLKEFGLDKVKEIILEDNNKQVKKSVVKGGRLLLYPLGFRLYRVSRGVKRPIKELMKYAEAKEKVGFNEPTSSTSLSLLNDSGTVINFLTIENYIKAKV